MITRDPVGFGIACAIGGVLLIIGLGLAFRAITRPRRRR
jgi:hypothetical protein